MAMRIDRSRNAWPRRVALLLAASSLVGVGPAVAQVDEAAAARSVDRPRVALVLSGGGARGFAHVGVLRVLRELKVPIDIVVGTSMGSVVGGAYAAGNSVEALEEIVRGTDWDSVVADRPARDTLGFRRREDDLLLPSRIEFGVTRSGITLPPSAAGNAALEMALSRLMPPGARDRPVSQLPIPFRSVASDLVTGELVELIDTPLFMAMRASLAVPGVFAPVRLNQRLLVDGGLVRNLPIDLARAMGAEVVIAVNVGTPLAPESELGNAVGVAQQMLRILTEQNVQRSLKELGPGDILIAPDLSGISFLDFHAHEQAMRVGEAAARQLTARLRSLSTSDEHFTAFEARRLAAPVPVDTALPLARLAISGADRIDPEALRAQSGLQEGKVATLADVRQAAATLYGRADLERVEAEVEDHDGQRGVEIRVAEAVWARSRLRIGLELGSDFADANAFNLGLMHVASSLNGWGAELRTLARIGTQRQLGTQWWQPLGPGSPWYLAPSLQYGNGAADLFLAGRRLLRVDVKSSRATLAMGRQLADWGDLQWGVTRQLARIRALVPDDPAANVVHAFDTSDFVQLRVDTLDSLAFPRRGHLLLGLWERSRAESAGATSLARSQLTAMTAFGLSDWAGHVYAEWARAQVGPAPVNLGGFLRLSGTPANSIDGHTVVLGRLVLARRIAAMPVALGGNVRAGFSLELGGGFAEGEAVRAGAMRRAASGFLSVDTRFGPLFLGAGATHGTGGTMYLFLGPIWQ
jgi:NTE family protein